VNADDESDCFEQWYMFPFATSQSANLFRLTIFRQELGTFLYRANFSDH